MVFPALRTWLKVYVALGAMLAVFPTANRAQTTIWSDNFNNGCAAGCIANTYGGWTILDNDGGTTGGAPNNWFVSCAEEGIVPPGCGSSCVGDASLHIGANPGAGGDMGASFNETGATNATFRMAVSPTVNTSGFSTINLSFDFIAFGSAACSDDRAQLRLSTDNGATWPAGFQYCLTSVCCGACNGYSQGQWTTYTVALPAAFNNNPNVRIGFHWRNNGNGSGTDPSVAIDDVRFTTTVFPVELVKFNAREEASKIRLTWVVAQEERLDRYEIERSTQPSGFKAIGTVPAKGNQHQGFVNYSFDDAQKSSAPMYYRLRMVDQNGVSTHSNVLRVVAGATVALALTATNPLVDNGQLNLQLWAADNLNANFEVHDLEGKILLSLPNQAVKAGENRIPLNLSSLPASVYMLRVKALQVPEGFDPVNIVQKFVLTK